VLQTLGYQYTCYKHCILQKYAIPARGGSQPQHLDEKPPVNTTSWLHEQEKRELENSASLRFYWPQGAQLEITADDLQTGFLTIVYPM
jgi:hypothetical protein